MSGARPGNREFFGRGEQFFYRQEWRAGFSIFKGETAFQPVAWEVKITPTFNLNYLHTQEVGLVNIDIREGRTRFDGPISLQEGYFELTLRDLPRRFPCIPRDEGEEASGDGDGWMASFLTPILEGAGYRVTSGLTAGETAAVVLAPYDHAPPATVAPVVRLRRSRAARAGDDSIYRYDRAALLSALEARTGARA